MALESGSDDLHDGLAAGSALLSAEDMTRRPVASSYPWHIDERGLQELARGAPDQAMEPERALMTTTALDAVHATPRPGSAALPPRRKSA